MAKHLNVNLAFSADTSQAKVQLQELQRQLNQLSLSSNAQLGLTSEIEDAARAAAELSVHLKKATNVETGVLDFAKLNQSIKSSGTTLQQYGNTLRSLGPQGQQAFMSLSQAIVNSEVPMRRTNALLKQMGTTLANTARWQLSSSMLHGFMGAVQSAYGYAQDLNESLNNIRIVTGQNIEQMAKFAEQANKAAKALSTTTTEYTNASLIYYQQGLNEQQVKERTDITIKMANVSRQSAEIVSDQMTAVWNNFYKGGKSLEYYADVMTALGAATASSTQEISDGLEKFAAIADTVGLSYEYAAAALATVTATTRQSADVVGTAFKTLFARIQDLELGKTLDDGTDLGKYSQALNAVGINIKDVNGDMKSMDAILDELGTKWQTLSKDTQIALAQTVAGTRQYTQLVALMDNWTFMEQNLHTATSSSGALDAQAKIYAESWEAAADRVTAAAEKLYKSLINDEFFIDVLNSIENLLDLVDDFISSLGGLKGSLTAIGAIVTKVFSNQIAQGLSNAAYNIRMMTASGRKAEAEARQSFIDKAIEDIPQNAEYTSGVEEKQQDSMRSSLTLQSQYMANVDRMSEVEAEVNKKLIERVTLLREAAIEAERQKEAAVADIDNAEMDIKTNVAAYNMSEAGKSAPISLGEVQKLLTEHKKLINAQSEIEASANKVFMTMRSGSADAGTSLKSLKQQVGANKDVSQELKLVFERLNEKSTVDDVQAAMRLLNAELETLAKNSGNELKNLVGKDTASKVDELTAALKKKAEATRESTSATSQAAAAEEKASQSIATATGRQKQWSDILVSAANVAFSTASALQMLSSAWETLQDPDVSGWDKFLSITMSLGMAIPMIISLYKTLKSIISSETVVKIANAIATLAQAAAERKLQKEKDKSSEATKRSVKETLKDTKDKITKTIKNKGKQLKNDWNDGAYRAQQGNFEQVRQIKGKDGKLVNVVKDKTTGKFMTEGYAKKMVGKGALKSAGTAAAGAAIVAASVAAAAFIISKAVDYYNRYDKAAQKAKEVAESVKATADQVKATEDDFQSKLDDYDNGVKGLENLTKGTEEYKDAVREANEAAIELLNTHKDLKYEINSEGLIVINDEDLAAARRQSIANSARASAVATAAQQDANTAQLEADKVKFQRSTMKAGGPHWDKDDTTAVGGGVAAGGALAAGGAILAAGAVNGWNPVGWALLIAGAVTAAIGAGIAIFNNDADDREAKTLSALEEMSIEQGGRSLTKDEIANIANQYDKSGKLADSLLKDVDATNEMIKQMRENTEAIRRNNELIAAQLLQGNEYASNSEHLDSITTASGLVYGKEYQKELQELEDAKWGKEGISKATGVNDEVKKIWSEYVNAAGVANKGWQVVDTTGTDKNRKFVYLDENGNRLEKTLEEMMKAVASFNASNTMNTNADKLVGLFADWASKQDSADQAIAAFLLNRNFEASTQSEVETMKGEVVNGDYKGYLRKKLGNLEQAAQQLGYENADKLVAAFKASLNSINTAWDDIDLSGMDEGLTKQMSVSTAQALEHLVKNMNSSYLGEVAGEDFLGGLNTMLANVDPKDQEEILQKIVNIDWSQWDAGREVVDIIKAMGYELEVSEEVIDAWILQMNKANNAVYDYGQAFSELGKMRDMVNDLSLGDIITQEDYEMLCKYNDEIARYFRMLGDGSYELVGDPLDAIQEIGKGIDDNIRKSLDGAKASYDALLARQKIDESIKATKYTQQNLQSSAWGKTGEKDIYEKDPNAWDYVEMAYHNVFIKALGRLDFSNRWKDAGDFTDKKKKVGTEEFYGVKDTNLYKSQLDYIEKNLKGYSDEVKEWRKNYEAGKTTEAETKAVADVIANALKNHVAVGDGDIQNAKDAIEHAEQAILAAEVEYAKTAQNSDQLDRMYEKGQISKEAYSAAQMDWIQAAKWEGVDPNEVEKIAKGLQDAATKSELLYDNMDEEAAEDVALYMLRMNKGVEALGENFEDWNSILTESDASSQEYIEAMDGVKDAMSNVLGVSKKFISNDFILEHMEDIKLAAEGDADAIDRLAVAAGRDILVNLDIKDQNVVDNILSLHDQLAAELPNIEIGATINDSEFLSKAAQIVQSAGMTAEQANAYFRSLGFEAKFASTKVQIPKKATKTITRVTEWSDGFLGMGKYPIAMETTSQEYEDGTTTVEVPSFTTDGSEPAVQLTKVSSGAMNSSSGSNGGGAEGSTKPAEPTSKSDVVERYKEINDLLADSSASMDKASAAADRLWGPSRVNAMKAVNDALENNIELLKQKQTEAKGYLLDDTENLQNVLTKEGTGIQASFDANGNISNYDAIMTGLYNELHDAETSAGDEWDESEQEKIEAIQDRIDKVKEAIGQYDETKELVESIGTEIQDSIYQWQDNNYEVLNLELSYEMGLNESELEVVNYQMSKIEDSVYSLVESFATLSEVQNGLYTDNLTAQENYINALTDSYEKGEISLSAYKEGLASSQDAIISNLESLEAQKEAMQDYYGNVMSKAMDEINQYTDEMGELNSVLDHYSSVLALIGKENDYNAQRTILTAQASNLKNEMEVQQEIYQKSSEQASHWAAKMATAIEGSDAYETYKKNWEAAQKVAASAQDEMLAKTEEWAESMKSIIENELASLAETLEHSLTGGVSFDELMTTMERRSSLQEEYLTATNQLYETNKMMRAAQKEIDQTSNTATKKRLQSFVDETAALQNKTKLSKYELDVQQAKYDLLIAQIALEEAQNAKSTVRLQRDAEGNFGYVYTADSAAVNDAEQNVADKENALYNLGLQGANDYAQKYIEIERASGEAIRELTEMWMSGDIATEEEYRRRKDELQQYYYEQLQQYSSLYQTALTTDSAVVRDAWTTDFNDMIYKTDEWKTSVETYFTEAEVQMTAWKDVCNTVLEESGLDDMEAAVGDISTRSTELAQTLLGEDGESGTVGAMMSLVDAAKVVSESQVPLQEALSGTITKYEELLTAVNNAYKAMTQPVDPAISPESADPPENKTPNTNNTTNTKSDTITTSTIITPVTNTNKITPIATPQSVPLVTKPISPILPPVAPPIVSAVTGMHPGMMLGGGFNRRLLTSVAMMDTGGYTGEWGPSGKLAVLHEKEIVLNETDTKNLLSIVEMLRTIDMHSLSAQVGGILSTPGFHGGDGGTLEQNVKIEASFPNVQDRNEIEEAFNNLINRASQYANRG